jgi:hypothetical protein
MSDYNVRHVGFADCQRAGCCEVHLDHKTFESQTGRRQELRLATLREFTPNFMQRFVSLWVAV